MASRPHADEMRFPNDVVATTTMTMLVDFDDAVDGRPSWKKGHRGVGRSPQMDSDQTQTLVNSSGLRVC